MARRIPVSQYKQDIKFLRTVARGFTPADGLDLRTITRPGDISKSMRAKINHYMRELTPLTTRPYALYKPRSPEKLALAQQASGHERKLRDLRAAFVPQHLPGAKVKVDVNLKTKRVQISEGSFSRIFLPLDPEALAQDPRGEITAQIAQAPGAAVYTIQTGKYETHTQYVGTRALTDRIIQWMHKYRDEDKNNYWENWLHGINAYGSRMGRQRAEEQMRRFERLRREFREEVKRTRRKRVRRPSGT